MPHLAWLHCIRWQEPIDPEKKMQYASDDATERVCRIVPRWLSNQFCQNSKHVCVWIRKKIKIQMEPRIFFFRLFNFNQVWWNSLLVFYFFLPLLSVVTLSFVNLIYCSHRSRDDHCASGKFWSEFNVDGCLFFVFVWFISCRSKFQSEIA